jgi:Tfp pilus assembly protein PilN
VIKTNLATRPFYNDSAVRLWLIVLALVAIAVTVFNVTRLLQYSRSDTELATQASRDEASTVELRTTAAQLRSSVDPKQVENASLEARLANDLIDRRAFSWTELFNAFEATLPDEVRITAVRPKVEEDRRVILTITVLARSVEDLDEFETSLEDTGAFRDLVPREDRVNEQGQIEGVIETEYVPKKAGPEGAPAVGAAVEPVAGRSR